MMLDAWFCDRSELLTSYYSRPNSREVRGAGARRRRSVNTMPRRRAGSATFLLFQSGWFPSHPLTGNDLTVIYASGHVRMGDNTLRTEENRRIVSVSFVHDHVRPNLVIGSSSSGAEIDAPHDREFSVHFVDAAAWCVSATKALNRGSRCRDLRSGSLSIPEITSPGSPCFTASSKTEIALSRRSWRANEQARLYTVDAVFQYSRSAFSHLPILGLRPRVLWRLRPSR
jgi:hypothetical protein